LYVRMIVNYAIYHSFFDSCFSVFAPPLSLFKASSNYSSNSFRSSIREKDMTTKSTLNFLVSMSLAKTASLS